MNELPIVKLTKLALTDANYQYDLISKKDNRRPFGGLLLLGHWSETNEITLEKCLNVPLTLSHQGDLNATFEYDSGQVSRRIGLLNVTNPHLKPVGLMVFNDKLYDYTKIVEKISSEVLDLNWVFTYEPRTSQYKKPLLYCYRFECQPTGIGLTRIDFQIQSDTIDLDRNNAGVRRLETLTEKQEIANETERTTKLIAKLDRIIAYLEKSQNNNSKILRSISLLVVLLKRRPTEDIEEEIMNKECEINAIVIACEQWETGISRNSENDL